MQANMMDRAFWISWYDLADSDRADVLTWTQKVYIPKVLERPGVLWAGHYASQRHFTPLGGGGGRISHKQKAAADVPTGDRYILIFGATEPHAFVNPSPRDFHAHLSEHDQQMLGKRAAERRNIMLQEGRIDGPDSTKGPDGMLPASAIQLGSFNAASFRDEETLADWYARWRLPSLENLPGCVRVRKLVSVAGWAKHACFYEFTSLEAREQHFVHYEKSRPDIVKWSTDVVRDTIHAPGSANVAKLLYAALSDEAKRAAKEEQAR
jgi:hypothetical protein